MTGSGAARGAAGVALAVVSVAAIGYFAYWGSDEWHEEQTASLNAAADARLASALAATDPCVADLEHVKTVMDALASKQVVNGDVDTLSANVSETLRRPVKSIARAQARGELAGVTKKRVDDLAKAFDLDPTQPGWSDDPKCETQWTVTWDQDSDVPGGGRVHIVGTIPVTVRAGGPVSGTGKLDATIQLSVAAPFCTMTMTPAATSMTIAGTADERQQQFALKFSSAAYTVKGRAVCNAPGVGNIETPLDTPMQAMSDFAMNIPMRDGAQARDERAGLTVTVHRISPK